MSSNFPRRAQRLGEAVRPPPDDVVAVLLRRANADLRRWGHAGHEVVLERAVAYFADPRILRCTFWCETCHVAQVVLLPTASAS